MICVNFLGWFQLLWLFVLRCMTIWSCAQQPILSWLFSGRTYPFITSQWCWSETCLAVRCFAYLSALCYVWMCCWFDWCNWGACPAWACVQQPFCDGLLLVKFAPRIGLWCRSEAQSTAVRYFACLCAYCLWFRTCASSACVVEVHVQQGMCPAQTCHE
jgi:hypothetical protein